MYIFARDFTIEFRPDQNVDACSAVHLSDIDLYMCSLIKVDYEGNFYEFFYQLSDLYYSVRSACDCVNRFGFYVSDQPTVLMGDRLQFEFNDNDSGVLGLFDYNRKKIVRMAISFEQLQEFCACILEKIVGYWKSIGGSEADIKI